MLPPLQIRPSAMVRTRPAVATDTVQWCPSPASSTSSSSDFEFVVSFSPTSKCSPKNLCAADELFYKGQLLPLQLSQRISMVRSLLASASASSTSETATNGSRDSNGSTSSSLSTELGANAGLDLRNSSRRPSSVADDDVLWPQNGVAEPTATAGTRGTYFSSIASRLSSVLLHRGSVGKKVPTGRIAGTGDANKKLVKDVIKKYVKRVKPLYEKLSSTLHQNQTKKSSGFGGDTKTKTKNFSFSIRKDRKKEPDAGDRDRTRNGRENLSSFSGNLLYRRAKRCAASCPSSMRSSPNHSGLLSAGGFPDNAEPPARKHIMAAASSMEELQCAIESAIAHCKSSLAARKA